MPDEPEDGDYITPPDFDLDGDWSQDQAPEVEALASQYGWESWRDVIAPEEFYDETNVRPGVYHTAEDAIKEAYEMGILSFSHILYDPLDDEWHLVVDDDSGG